MNDEAAAAATSGGSGETAAAAVASVRRRGAAGLGWLGFGGSGPSPLKGPVGSVSQADTAR